MVAQYPHVGWNLRWSLVGVRSQFAETNHLKTREGISYGIVISEYMFERDRKMRNCSIEIEFSD